MNNQARLLKVLLLCAATCGISMDMTRAHAEDRPLDAPRAQGLLGERYDGFVVVHDTAAAADLAALVAQTNDERRKVYAAQAQATGAQTPEVGKVYAIEIMNKAPAGTWFQAADGSRKKK